ncbi:MAG: apolipoprotein N-acyltransferase [Acidimicrobiia bacterium]|nr:apolipoprotein N-acyltransferase [Acidimicrobiia bacterium]
MVSFFVALAAAAVAVLGFPPFGFGLLTVPAVGMLLWALRKAPSGLVAALAATTYGLAFFGLLMWWISRTDPIALIGLAVSQAVFMTGFGWFAYRQRHLPLWRWTVAVTGGWALMEFLRGWAPFGGLRWGALGYSMVPYAPARGAAALIGAAGWTVVIVCTAAIAVFVFDRVGSRRVLVWPLGIWVALFGIGAIWPAVADGPDLRVTVVQGNTPCVEHCAGDRVSIYENHLRLTRTIPAGSADLVIWGESSAGFSKDPLLDPAVAAEIAGEAQRIGAFFLIGSDRPVGDEHFVNANMLFSSEGVYLGEYNKRHPVPFGEYVPWRPVFGLIPVTSRVPRDMVRGAGPVVFDIGAGTIGSVISFEGSFSRYTRDHVREGAQLMVIATNERSYGVGPAADQLIDMTRMHAAENGVDLVQAAITGKSAIVTNGGEIDVVTDLYAEAVISGTVRFRSSGRTLTNLWGNWVPVLAVMGLFFSLARARLEEARNETEGH